MARRVPLTAVNDAINCLEEDGGVILSNFASEEDVKAVNDDACPYIDAIAKKREMNGEPRGTVRCHRLFGRSRIARERWLQRTETRQILNHFLSSSSLPYNDQSGCPIETDPILSASATMEISPGEKAQHLHRDDFIWQQTHLDSRELYTKGSDVGMGILVPGVKTTRANGATAFVPRSHLWSHARCPTPEEVKFAEMEVGEAFVFLGSTVHGGGTNTADKSRTVHGFFFCRSWMRPEENQFLWWTKEEVAKWSTAAQKQAGYLLDSPFLGHCDETSPWERFRVSDHPAERRDP